MHVTGKLYAVLSVSREGTAPRPPRRAIMTMMCEGSVTCWIGDLKSGGDAASQHLWERCFDRLVRLARERLRARAGAAEDAEDAAQSAFNSFCGGAAESRFPRLADRDDLWRLLVVITVRKAMSQLDAPGRHQARRRPAGGGLSRVPQSAIPIRCQSQRLQPVVDEASLAVRLGLGETPGGEPTRASFGPIVGRGRRQIKIFPHQCG